MLINCFVKFYVLFKEFLNFNKKMGRLNKFENILIDEKVMNDFIFLRIELMFIILFYFIY